MWNHTRHTGRATGRATAGAALALLFALTFVLAALSSAAQAQAAPRPPAQPDAPVAIAPAQGLVEDLEVAEGETFDGDAVVYGGDARIRGTVTGNLVVRAGDVEIEQGGRVNGDVTVWSGDVDVAGSVGGNVISMAGDIALEESARVVGDVSTLAGEIRRQEGASVGGNIVRGPKLSMPDPVPGLPGLPGFDAPPAAPAAPGSPTVVRVEQGGRSLAERVLGVLGRLIFATLLTLLATALAAILYNIRPGFIDAAHARLRAHPARSFLLGLGVNAALGVAMGIFFALFCTAPVGAVAGLLLVALNLAGWTVIALALGRRLSKPATLSQSKFSVNVALGALLLTAVPAYGWALLSFFGVTFGALLLVLALVAAPGVGALLWPVFERVSKGGRLKMGGRGARTATPPGAQTVQGTASVAGMPAAAAAAPALGSTSAASYTTAGNPPAAGAATLPSPVVDVPVAPAASVIPPGPGEGAALDAASAVSGAAAVEDARRDAAEGVAVDETLLETPTQELPAAQAQPLGSEGGPDEPAGVGGLGEAGEPDEEGAGADADFTGISGIGRTWDARLKAAGIRTFAQLAAQTPESLAAALGITPEQVIVDDLIGQARAR